MKLSFLIILLCGCRSLDQKIIQRSAVPDLDPNHATVQKQTFIVFNKSQSEPTVIVNINPPHNINWSIDMPDTNMPQTGLLFDVEKSDTLTNPTWTLFCQTNQPPVEFFSTGDQGFFRVGAHFVTLSMPAPFGR